MAVIEVNVSTLRVQPVARRYRTHPLQKVIHSTSHSPPGLQKTQFPAGKPRCAWSFVALWFASGLFSVGTATITVAERRVKPAMRFPVYESLYFLNRNLHDILVILEEMKRSPGMPQRSFEADQVEIQCLRSHDTQDVLEGMNDTEIHEM